MTIREQYKLAYSLLRDKSYSQWDFRTYKLTCKSFEICDTARLAALNSYLTSLLIDEIGESYRKTVDYRLYGGGFYEQ